MITLYSFSDFAYQTLRLLILAWLCYLLTIPYGLFAYLAIQQGFYKMMWHLFQCEHLTT